MKDEGEGKLASAGWVVHGGDMTMSPLKIIIEKYASGYVAYPLGLRNGAIAGQGDTYEEALADVRSAILFHQETFGPDSLALEEDDPLLDAFVADAFSSDSLHIKKEAGKVFC